MLQIQLKQFRFLTVTFLLGMVFTSCRSPAPEALYCFVAQRVQTDGMNSLTLTYTRKFEKKSWCEADIPRLEKQGFQAECRLNETAYDSMFRGEAAGQWYLLQKIGRFPPSVIVYDFKPSLPDELMLANLRQIAPQAVKFAALHRAPAEALIFSPTGEIKSHEKINQPLSQPE